MAIDSFNISRMKGNETKVKGSIKCEADGSHDNTRVYIEKVSDEEESNGDNEKEDTEEGDGFSETLIAHDLSNVQETTTGNYCEKCGKAFKNKAELRRQLITAHVKVRKLPLIY